MVSRREAVPFNRRVNVVRLILYILAATRVLSDIWVLFFSLNRWDYLALFLGRLHWR